MIDNLSYETAEEIFKSIRSGVSASNDADVKELYEDYLKSCFAYAGTRAEWAVMSREEKMDADRGRTMAHDMVIQNLKILKRAIKPFGIPKGLDMIAPDDEDISVSPNRKVVGDFACFVTCILGIENR